MLPNITAVLPDPEYAEKYRTGKYIASPSKWEWGMADDGELYCRDDGKGSTIPDFFLVKKLPLYIDFNTIQKLSKWGNSLILKSKLKPFLDSNPS